MKLFLPSILFFAIASFAPDAFGQSLWTGGAGDGLWASANNWFPAGEPTGDASIDSPATITLPDVTTTVGVLTLTNSTISLNASSLASFTATVITVDNGGTLNLNIPTGGQVISTNTGIESSFVGDGNGTGTLFLTGSGSLNYTSATEGSGVGFGGTGTFNQSGSTIVNVTSIFGIGADGNVTNPASLPPNSTTANGGMGTYNLSGSAVLNASAIAVGIGSGLGAGVTTGGATPTVGILNITGGTLNAGSLSIGVNNTDPTAALASVSGAVNQSAGAATIGDLEVGVSPGAVASYMLTGGTIGATTPSTTITLGTNAGAIGTFQQSGATTVETGTLNVGEGGSGTYLLQGGTLTVDTTLSIGGSSAPVSTLTQSGGSTLIANGAFNIGTGGGTGVFNYNTAANTLTLSSGIAIGATGTFNQNASISLTNDVTQAITVAAGGAYNLNGGTLTTQGDVFTGAGNFNFAGGTVAVTGTTWTDGLNGIISGSSTINTAAGDAILSGNLTGNGTLRVTGGGTVSLTTSNNSAAGWGVNVADGTVSATATLFPSSGAITIGSGGVGATGAFTLAVAGGVPVILTGKLTSTGNSGTGMFDANFATAGDTLELTNKSNNYSGTIALNGGGTLELFGGTYGNISGTGAVGIGDPAVATGGTVTLAGTNSYNGPTTVNNTFTLFTSNLTGDVSVQTGGTFGSGLTPATLPPVQVTTVALGGMFNSTGTIRLASNGVVTDLYTVTGTSTLSGTVLLSGVGTVTSHVFIHDLTPGGLDTAGLTLAVTGAGVLFKGSILQVGDDEELTTTQIGTAAFALTPNELAVANSIDPVLTSLNTQPGFLPLGTALNNLPASAIPGALEELTPESLQYARMICFENSSYLVERMNGVDADLRGGYGGLDTSAISVISPGFNSGTGRSLGSFLASNSAYHQPAPNGVNYYPGEGGGDTTTTPASTPTWNSSTQVISDSPNPYMANQSPSGTETPGFSEFISGDAVLADLNQNQSTANAPSSKASYTAEDAAAGVSFRMNSHLAAGVLFDYSHTDAKTDGNGSKTHVDSYEPGLFATYFDHGFYANGLFSFGYNNYSNTRNIAFMGDTATSHPSGQQYIGDLDFGYDFHPDKCWVVGPTLGVTYTHLDIDSITETGAPGADLNVDSQSADSLRSRLGAHAVFQTNTGDVLLQPNITAMWQHEYLDNGSGITSSFNDFSASPFTIQTAAPSRDSALVGVGLTATLNNSMALYFNYLADVGASNYFAHSVVGGFKARF